MAMTQEEAQAALSHPDFSHTRAGSGCWRDLVWIYHRDRDSPSGVKLFGATNEAQLKLLTVPRGGAPLSPTEPR